MNLRIRKTVETDLPVIVQLMQEFARHQNLDEYLDVTEETLHDVLFGRAAFVESLIALDNIVPVAYAFFYPSFSSFRGQKSVYLEDIFITEKFRKFGIGEKMLKEIATIGKHNFGASRMDFQVLSTNEAAINFYKNRGAVLDEEERHVKIIDESFQKLTKK